MIDVPSISMGFGFGAVAGAILCNMLGLHHFETVFFFIGGFIGAVVGAGVIGDFDIAEAFS